MSVGGRLGRTEPHPVLKERAPRRPKFPPEHVKWKGQVLDGIQKRLERILDPEALRRRLTELLRPVPMAAHAVTALESRLAETRRKIGRPVEALAGGPEGLPAVRSALVDLERKRARLEAELAGVRKTARPAAPGRLQQTLDGLLEALHRVRDVLAAGTLEERRAVVRSFLAGIRIEKATRQAVLRWYRLPRDLSLKLVELRGVEPLTPRLPASCSPN